MSGFFKTSFMKVEKNRFFFRRKKLNEILIKIHNVMFEHFLSYF